VGEAVDPEARRARWTDRLLATVLRGFVAACTAISLRSTVRLGRGLADLFFFFGLRRRNIDANLDLIYGDRLSRPEKRAIARSANRNLFLSALEMVRSLDPTARDELVRTVEFEPRALLDDLAADDRGLVASIAHSGNFDLAGLGWIHATGRPLCVVMKPLAIAPFNDFLVESRRRFGFEVTGNRESGMLRGLMRRVNEGGVVCMLPDQHARRLGVVVDFLGQPASTHRGPGFLIAKTDKPRIIVMVGVRVDDDARHVYHLREITDFVPTGHSRSDVAVLTQRICDAMTEVLEQHPESYLWHHRRWRVRHDPRQTA
jgi:KDO2-lipid IV(A) lauroyltransferase